MLIRHWTDLFCLANFDACLHSKSYYDSHMVWPRNIRLHNKSICSFIPSLMRSGLVALGCAQCTEHVCGCVRADLCCCSMGSGGWCWMRLSWWPPHPARLLSCVLPSGAEPPGSSPAPPSAIKLRKYRHAPSILTSSLTACKRRSVSGLKAIGLHWLSSLQNPCMVSVAMPKPAWHNLFSST